MDFFRVIFVEPIQKELNKEWHVFYPLAQRRHFNREDIQSIIKVTPVSKTVLSV